MQAKIILSSSIEGTIELDSINYQKTITRSEFEFICKKHFDKLIPIIELALKDANLTKDRIEKVVLVGRFIFNTKSSTNSRTIFW